jgi:toxin YoeB
MNRRVVFEFSAFEDFNNWAVVNKKIYQKIVKLIYDIDRSPSQGLGKPEALKHDLQGYWSRRIDKEHRLVYRVNQKTITIISCKYHY